jgi:hypothetical protein
MHVNVFYDRFCVSLWEENIKRSQLFQQKVIASSVTCEDSLLLVETSQFWRSGDLAHFISLKSYYHGRCSLMVT